MAKKAAVVAAIGPLLTETSRLLGPSVSVNIMHVISIFIGAAMIISTLLIRPTDHVSGVVHLTFIIQSVADLMLLHGRHMGAIAFSYRR